VLLVALFLLFFFAYRRRAFICRMYVGTMGGDPLSVTGNTTTTSTATNSSSATTVNPAVIHDLESISMAPAPAQPPTPEQQQHRHPHKTNNSSPNKKLKLIPKWLVALAVLIGFGGLITYNIYCCSNNQLFWRRRETGANTNPV
jgi:hypothetical protein